MNLTDAFSVLEHALRDTTRAEILDALQRSRDSATGIARLRTRMREHRFPTSGATIALDRIVHDFDRRTRAEGFHALQSWNYHTHRFVDDSTAVLMLNRVAGHRASAVAERVALSALLDQYFLWMLGLLALRAWDGDDPNVNLDRVTSLLRLLKPAGQRESALVEDASLLLLLAVSQYHPQEQAYGNLLERVRSLDKAHRTRIAVFTAATLAGHLRWGFRFMYQRDHVRMRDDNVVDYPWLFFSLETLLDSYGEASDNGASDAETAVITTALINGLTADPWMLTDERSLPPQLHRRWCRLFADQLSQCTSGLLPRFDAHRPDAKRYSPLGFDCNYLHNVIVAMIEVATTEACAQESLDVLLTGGDGEAIHALGSARRLARYAACTSQAVGGAALIAYDSYNGSKCFDAAMDVLRHLHEIA